MPTPLEKARIVKNLNELEAIQQQQTYYLPHLYGMKWYSWAKKFFDSMNRFNLIVSGNQVSKSSSLIRRAIHRATAQDQWEKWWPTKPTMFWYFYPTLEVSTREFENKWVKEWLPRGPYVDHPVYGWKADYKHGQINACHFNSGVSIYFNSYKMSASDIQTSSIYELCLDEELPIELLDELLLRIQSPSVKGNFNMVFTATLGQQFWRQVMEGKGRDIRWPHAFKQQISMYDCLKYEDGSNSPWTIAHINEIKKSCKTKSEVLRRVYGRFVVSDALKYPTFNRTRHYVERPDGLPAGMPPKGWEVYAAVDVGSGGRGGKHGNHPSAIGFMAINRTFTKARLFKLWIGGPDEITTAGDVFKKYLQLSQGLKVVRKFYDWACRDFFIIASRHGEGFEPADKNHETGEEILSTLFKWDVLKIYKVDENTDRCVEQLENLQKDISKSKADDEGPDVIRYIVSKLNFNFEKVMKEFQEIIEGTKEEDENDGKGRKYTYLSVESLGPKDEIEAEFAEWNELYEGQ